MVAPDSTYRMFFSRKFATPYRYGFNGKEKDDEVKGSGNQYDYGFRIFNPQLGRFLSVDPLTKNFPYYTPYQFAGNKPIMSIDLDGLEEIYYMGVFSEGSGKELISLVNKTQIFQQNEQIYKGLDNPGRNLVFIEGTTTPFYAKNSTGETMTRYANGNAWALSNADLALVMESEDKKAALAELLTFTDSEGNKIAILDKGEISDELIAVVERTYKQGRALDLAVINPNVVHASEHVKWDFEKSAAKVNAGVTIIHEFVSHIIENVTGVGGHFNFFAKRDESGNIVEKDVGQYGQHSPNTYQNGSQAKQAQEQMTNAVDGD